MEDFKDQVKKSFNACKTDIESLKQENEHLKNKLFSINNENKSIKEENLNIKSQITELRAEIKGLSIAINYIKEFSEKQMLAQNQTPQTAPTQPNSNQEYKTNSNKTLSETYSQATEFSEMQSYHNPYNDEIDIEEPLSIQKKPTRTKMPQQPPSKDPYEALLAFKAKANKKEILKQKLITMIGEGGMNLSELKFMFVDHFRYCSKATFYNYLNEMEMEKSIKIERQKNKNYIYQNSIGNEQ